MNQKMKLVLLPVLILAGFSLGAYSQEVKLNLYGVYNFQDKFDSYYSSSEYYNGTLKEGFLWGGGIEKKLSPYNGIELLYLREDTHAPTTYAYSGQLVPKNADLDVTINYVLLGFNRYVGNPHGRAMGYGGFVTGVGFGDLRNNVTNKTESYSKFTWGLRLGGEIAVSPSVAIKLQAQYYSMIQAMSGSIYVGTGGAGTGVAGYSTIGQFGLGGGLAFKFGGASSAPTQPAM